MRRLIYPVLGLSFVVAGFDKLAGLRSYERLFRGWGWSRQSMQSLGAGEIAGGLLIMLPFSRMLGAALLTGLSGAVLEEEARHDNGKLAAARLGLLALAASALFVPSRRSRR